MKSNEERLCWIDLETTGLDPDSHVVLEVACVVTDNSLKELSSFSMVVSFKQRHGIEISPYVEEMHTKNGLWEECKISNWTLKQTDTMLSAFIEEHALGAPLCGSTISFDRGFMKKHLPQALSKLHYRNIDVSSFKELARRQAGIEIPKKEAHRALEDIRESIAALRELSPKWGSSWRA